MIITFYSYKAGVGKTTLVANLADYLFSILNKKVLIIDWDIASPEIDLFFNFKRNEIEKGFIDLFIDYIEIVQTKSIIEENELPRLFDLNNSSEFIKQLKNSNSIESRLDLLPVSNYYDKYHNKILNFDWFKFYETFHGKYYIEKFKEELNKSEYDYILIDSGSGLNHYSTICNIQLPQINIFVTSPSEFHSAECLNYKNIIQKSIYFKQKRDTPIFLPILSKIDPKNVGFKEYVKAFSTRFRDEFISLYTNLKIGTQNNNNDTIIINSKRLNDFIQKIILYYDSIFPLKNTLIIKNKKKLPEIYEGAIKEISNIIGELVNKDVYSTYNKNTIIKKKSRFQSIRPYKNGEIKEVIEQLLDEPDFHKLLSVVYYKQDLSEVFDHLRTMTKIKNFQEEVVYNYLRIIVDKTINKLSFSGLENLLPDQNFLFISNYRDIILDPTLMNLILRENKIKTSEIATGSNILIFPWIEMLVKLNKSFIVRKNLPANEHRSASKELSAYIKNTILKKHRSVWIPQKEEQTKDGDDNTHPSLLKMLHISSSKPLSKYIKQLNLVPVSISYEVEPYEKSKTAEIYARLKNVRYIKDPKEDMMSMVRGLNNFKGRVHIHFGKILDKELDVLDTISNYNTQYVKLAKIIDERIHSNFRLFEGSYIAYDILTGSDKFKNNYTRTDYRAFIRHFLSQIEDIQGDKEIIKQIFLGIYATPLINKYKLEKSLFLLNAPMNDYDVEKS